VRLTFRRGFVFVAFFGARRAPPAFLFAGAMATGPPPAAGGGSRAASG
jgi:hypothetical protein